MKKITVRILIMLLNRFGDDILFFIMMEFGSLFARLTTFTEWDDKKIQQLKDNPEEAKQAIREFMPTFVSRLKKYIG